MAETDDWTLATWEGSRRRQHQEFLALPFRDKLAVIEDLADLARFFAERRQARGSNAGNTVGPRGPAEDALDR